MNAKELEDWLAYLANCTTAQLLGCYEKEKKAGREEYALVAYHEYTHRIAEFSYKLGKE